MPKAPKQEDPEAVRTELCRLRRQHQILDSEVKDCGMKIKLSKQKRVIETLQKEKESLSLDVKLSTSQRLGKYDNSITMNIVELVSKQDIYDEAIKNEKSQLQKLKVQVRKVEDELLQIRQQDVNDHEINKKRERAVNMIYHLRNRLHGNTASLCKTIARNNEMREELDHLLKEREIFNFHFNKIMNQMNNGKKIMLDLTEQATRIFAQRGEVYGKLSALKERDSTHLKSQSLDMRLLQRQMDQKTRMQNFLGTKGQTRKMADLEAKEAMKKQCERDAMVQLIQKYQGILSQAKDFTGEFKVDDINKKFENQMRENFAIFNFVNEISNEYEFLLHKNTNLKMDIQKQRELAKETAISKQETVSSLEKDLNESQQEFDEVLSIKEQLQSELNNILQGIDDILILINCDQNSVLQLLGSNANVTVHNVILYLGLIEKRTQDICKMVYYIENTTTVRSYLIGTDVRMLYSIKPLAPLESPCPLCLEQEFLKTMENTKVVPADYSDIKQSVIRNFAASNAFEKLHSVSLCQHEESRRIIQKRFA